jgi:hypothetical protein
VIPQTRRFAVCVALGIAAGIVSYRTPHGAGGVRDFTQVWYAAHAMFRGQDPYALIGPGRPMPFSYVLLYPLTAGVVAMPFAGLSPQWACTVFVLLGAMAFAWALSEHGWGPLLGLLGVGFFFAVKEAQWAPILAAGTVLTPLGVLYAAKPTIGTALFAAKPSWWPILGGMVLLVVSFAFQPHWVEHWRGAVMLKPPSPGAPERYRILLVDQPGAVFVLAALLRWRRPEARLLVALVCVPMTTVLYETTALALIPRGWKESVLLVVLGYVLLGIFFSHLPTPGAERLALGARWMTWLLYVPCTAMVLARPNEGRVAAWLEARLARWPKWLRGRSSAVSAG